MTKPKRVGYRHYTYRGFDIFDVAVTGPLPLSCRVWAWGTGGQKSLYGQPVTCMGNHNRLHKCVADIDKYLASQETAT